MVELFNPDYLWRRTWALEVLHNYFTEVFIDIFIQSYINFFRNCVPEELTLWPLSISNKKEAVN